MSCEHICFELNVFHKKDIKHVYIKDKHTIVIETFSGGYYEFNSNYTEEMARDAIVYIKNCLGC